jgi:hypothetical protein
VPVAKKVCRAERVACAGLLTAITRVLSCATGWRLCVGAARARARTMATQASTRVIFGARVIAARAASVRPPPPPHLRRARIRDVGIFSHTYHAPRVLCRGRAPSCPQSHLVHYTTCRVGFPRRLFAPRAAIPPPARARAFRDGGVFSHTCRAPGARRHPHAFICSVGLLCLPFAHPPRLHPVAARAFRDGGFFSRTCHAPGARLVARPCAARP